ncbi:MAG: phospholipid phosphatase, partial [Tannerellaceae bacterium]|nr:phospholipid phosphatase [Tannerellaceae bacterium]
MLERIIEYERGLFFMLNGSDSPFLDRFMWLYTGKVVWLPVAVLILAVLLYKKNWRESLLILVAIALVVTLCDQFAS